MTTRHIIEGVMQACSLRRHVDFAKFVGVYPSTVTRMLQDKYVGMQIETLDKIQQASGISFEKLMEWYRMPDKPLVIRQTIKKDKP